MALPTLVRAQSGATAGVTAGAAKLSDVRTELAVTGILQLRPRRWLTLSAIPSFIRVSDSLNGQRVWHSGVGDLPLVLGAAQSLPGAWSPIVGAALIFSLPTGNAACGLGAGETGLGLDGGIGVAPVARLRLSASASRSLGGFAQSQLSAPSATAVRLEGGYALSSRLMASAAFGADLGSGDSTQGLSRVVGAGAVYQIAGPLALTLDASHGLTPASPRWVVSLGLGTAFIGTSPVSPSSPLRRLKDSFTGSVNRGHGAGKTGTTTCS
jgi:hypothetical protein